MEPQSAKMFVGVAVTFAILFIVGITIGYMIGKSFEPDTDNPGPPIDEPPINTSMNLTINVLNVGTTAMDGQVWVYDEHGRELYYCSTFIHHSGRPNYIYVAWDNVTEYDNTTFTIVVRGATHQSEPIISTRTIEWLCQVGIRDTLTVTLDA